MSKSNLIFPLPAGVEQPIVVRFDGHFDPQSSESIQHFVGQRYAIENMFPQEVTLSFYNQMISSGNLDQLLEQHGYIRQPAAEQETAPIEETEIAPETAAAEVEAPQAEEQPAQRHKRKSPAKKA